jgi:hypothetical protein
VTQRTQHVISALLGLERDAEYAYPVEDVFRWADYSPALRFRWAALTALEAGDVAAAGVLAQLAQAVEFEHVGSTLLAAMTDEAEQDH